MGKDTDKLTRYENVEAGMVDCKPRKYQDLHVGQHDYCSLLLLMVAHSDIYTWTLDDLNASCSPFY